MAGSSRTAQRWAKRLAVEVRDELERMVGDPLLRLYRPGEMSAGDGGTDGWCVDIGRVRGVNGRLQVWFDTFPNVGRRRVSVAFQSFSKKVVLDLVSRGAAQVKQPGTYSDRDWGVGEDDTVKMNRPLPKRHFGRPLLELYERGGSAKFLTMYLPNVINPRSAPPREVVLKAARYLAAVIRAAIGVAYRGDAARDYSKIENRQRVQRHLVRERSVVLPRLAKERDHYTCRICRFNFSDRYGSVGRSFAEAHHTVPLSSVHAKKATVLADLITVCANCHRMLHRGKGISVSGLKAAMTGWWPE